MLLLLPAGAFRRLLFLTFECTAAKIRNYRFQSSNCRAIFAIVYLIVTLPLFRRSSRSRHATRSNRFRLARASEPHENRAISLRRFLLSNDYTLQLLQHAVLVSLSPSWTSHERFFAFPHSLSRKKKTAVLLRVFVPIYHTRCDPFLTRDFTYATTSLMSQTSWNEITQPVL